LKTLSATVGLLLFTIFPAPESFGQVFKTQQIALRDAFAQCDTVVRKTLFLTEEQVTQIQKLAKSKIDSKLVSYYVGIKNDSTCGYAFFESDIVRTKKATIMVVVNPDGTVRNLEMLAFYEPQDYLPTQNWFKLFTGKFLTDNLWPKRSIDAVSGATLTVRSVTLGLRKILAIYKTALSKEKRN